MRYRKLSFPAGFVLALLLSACAGRGAVFLGSPENSQPEYSGIQTRAIRAAPATQQARNESRPLSELDTPDAIAAREAAARSSPRPAPAAAMPAVSANSRSATAATEAALAASVGSAKAPALQKGSKVRVRNDAPLHSRPSASSEKLLSINVDGEVELGPQVYNADGYWWFIQVGKETGWLLQADILR